MHFEGLTISVSPGGVLLSVHRLSAYKPGPKFCHVDNMLSLEGLQNNSVHVSNGNIQPKKITKQKECGYNILTPETGKNR